MIFVFFQNAGKCLRLPVIRKSCTSGIGTLNKDIVVGVACYRELA